MSLAIHQYKFDVAYLSENYGYNYEEANAIIAIFNTINLYELNFVTKGIKHKSLLDISAYLFHKQIGIQDIISKDKVYRFVKLHNNNTHIFWVSNHLSILRPKLLCDLMLKYRSSQLQAFLSERVHNKLIRSLPKELIKWYIVPYIFTA